MNIGEPVADTLHDAVLQWEPGRMAWLMGESRFGEVTRDHVVPDASVFEMPFFRLLDA